MNFRAWLAPTTLLLVAAGCDDDPRKKPRVGWEEDLSSYPLPCDVEEPRCRTAIFQTVATLREQTEASLPPIRTISRAEYIEELMTDLGERPEDLRSTRFSKAMGLLNMIAPDQSLGEADSEASAQRVLAYYNHQSDDVTVISEDTTKLLDEQCEGLPSSCYTPEAMAEAFRKYEERGSFTLAHEIVHALQDQREDLSRLDQRFSRSWDSSVAVDALVEGEATWLALRFAAATSGADPERSSADDYFGSWIAGTLADIASGPSPLVIAQQLLPYGYGGARISRLWYDEGGDPSVEALYRSDEVGVTFARWVDGATVRKPVDLRCKPPASGPGRREYEVLDYFGIPGVIALYAGLGHLDSELEDLAAGWTGDWLAIFEPEDDSTREAAVAWRIGFASEAQAAELAAEATEQLGIRAEAQGDEVLLVAASTEALADELSGAVTCAASPRSLSSAVASPLHALRGRHVQYGRRR